MGVGGRKEECVRERESMFPSPIKRNRITDEAGCKRPFCGFESSKFEKSKNRLFLFYRGWKAHDLIGQTHILIIVVAIHTNVFRV